MFHKPLFHSSHFTQCSFRTGLCLGFIGLQSPSLAQSAPQTIDPTAPTASTALPEVVVTGKAEDLLGIAPAASKGQASGEELMARPVLRRGEILETIPGVIITQHAGGGKANQYFLRGFNLDHGTDFATSLEGMPLNLRTHAHGQGYTDLNPILPELISGVDYAKGTYDAHTGDLSSAGNANFSLYDVLPRNIISGEIGENGWYRGLIAGSHSFSSSAAAASAVSASGKSPAGKGPITTAEPTTPKTLTYGLEYNTYEGPFTISEDFNRWNGLVRWYEGEPDGDHFSLTAMAYRADWASADQIPNRAIQSGALDRLGAVDTTTGGESQRYSLNAAWQTKSANTTTKANVYGIYYDLDLFSNFTYFLDYPDQGDQFEQKERRWIVGGALSHQWEKIDLWGAETDVTIGLQTRHDIIGDIGLYRTEERRRFRTVREDSIYEGDVGLFSEMTNRWHPKFRTTLGLRGDLFAFHSEGGSPGNDGTEWDGIVSPKFTAVLGPWAETEFYFNFGTGFHSNDARGVTTSRDPLTGEKVDPVDPLVRTMGAEIGLRTQAIPDVTATLSAFWLESDSELVYIGDAGTNEAGPGSRRYGVEAAVYWRPVDWLTLDAEASWTHGRFTKSGNEDYIPSSVPMMFSGGLTVGASPGEDGLFASLRARAFSKRPLVEDNSVKGKASFLVNAGVGYRHGDWEAAVECLNLFDRKDNDIEYYYESRLANEVAASEDIHLHPSEPRTFRFRLTYHF